ncbi:MAG: CotH kinase family protein [Gammaproteobacteria bacterium]|nr:CotH kinase family protein [Gammaproteobacteria bacterium]
MKPMTLPMNFICRNIWILMLSRVFVLFFLSATIHAGEEGVIAEENRTKNVEEQTNLSPINIGTIHLKMRPVDAEVLFRKDPHDTSSFSVSIKDNDGKLLKGRAKVSGSFTRRFPKKNILIKLDGEQQWQGQRKISLDAMATDGSMQREGLVWQLAHALGMPGPKLQYVRVYINDRYKGLFMHTEWIDTGVMERYKLGADGQFFHPSDSKFCGDFLLHKKRSLKDCWLKLSPRDSDFSPLQVLSEKISQTPIAEFHEFLETHFDIDSVINWLALNVLTSNGDTYNKNYFLYQSTVSGKWVVIPWDYDLSFGRNWDAYLPFPKDILNDNFQYFYPPELGAPNPLKEKTLRNPVLNKLFTERMLHLLGEERHGPEATFAWFSPQAMHERINNTAVKLQPERIDDPYLKGSVIDFSQETESLWHYVQRRHAYLREIFMGSVPWNSELAIWNPADAPPRPPLSISLFASQEVPNNGQYSTIAAPAYGYLLAAIKLKDSNGMAKFSVESEIKHTPTIIPPGYDSSACIQRNWFVTLRTPFKSRVIDLQLDYLQEDSKRQELGSGGTEQNLKLWVLDGQNWYMLTMHVNPLSNVISVNNMTIHPLQMLHFVACSENK